MGLKRRAHAQAVALGCEWHVDPGEIGKLTFREWLTRLSIPELERLEEGLRRQEQLEVANASQAASSAGDER